MDAQSMPDVMKNRCYSSMRSSKIYTWTLNHNLCQDSISYFQCMNVTLLRKLVTHILYYIFRLSGILQPAVLISLFIPIVNSVTESDWVFYLHTDVIHTRILLILPARCNHLRMWDIEGSPIRALKRRVNSRWIVHPNLPFYCGFDRGRGFRMFRLVGV